MSFYVDAQASHVSQIPYLSRHEAIVNRATSASCFCFDSFCNSWKMLQIILFFHIREMLQS